MSEDWDRRSTFKTFLSNPAEWHAFTDGVWCGYHGHAEPTHEDSEEQRHYWQAGYLLGNIGVHLLRERADGTE